MYFGNTCWYSDTAGILHEHLTYYKKYVMVIIFTMMIETFSILKSPKRKNKNGILSGMINLIPKLYFFQKQMEYTDFINEAHLAIQTSVELNFMAIFH